MVQVTFLPALIPILSCVGDFENNFGNFTLLKLKNDLDMNDSLV